MDEVSLTQELIRINSENPPGNEREIAKYVRDFLDSLKIPVELIEIEKDRFNVVGTLGKEKGGIMFNGHMDTVPAGDLSKWRHDPFEGKIVGGKLYGRGASDMKCGLGAMLSAIQKIPVEKVKRKLLLAFVADEEAGQRGSEFIIGKRKDLLDGIDYGIVTDSSDLKIITAQKGITQITLGFTGKAAHASTPELGENAIYKAAEFIQELRKLSLDLKKTKDPVLGSGTLNVGKIYGGTKVNVVPDFCSVEVDRRIVQGESVSHAIGQISAILKRLKLKADVQVTTRRNPMVVGNDSEYITLLRSITRAKTSMSSGYIESEMYNNVGIKCVCFGPGLDAMCHIANEYVPVKNIQKAARLYADIMKRFCL